MGQANESVLDLQAAETKMVFDPFEGFGLVKKDMGGIVFVIPGFKFDFGQVKLGHAKQAAARVEQFFEQRKFAGRMVKVFDYFAAGDVIVGLGEMFGVGMKKGVVGLDCVALLLKQMGDHGPGSGAKIEAGMRWPVITQNSLDDGGNKGLVARVVNVVVVRSIVRFFGLGRGQTFGAKKNPRALRADVVAGVHGVAGSLAEGAGWR